MDFFESQKHDSFLCLITLPNINQFLKMFDIVESSENILPDNNNFAICTCTIAARTSLKY